MASLQHFHGVRGHHHHHHHRHRHPFIHILCFIFSEWLVQCQRLAVHLVLEVVLPLVRAHVPVQTHRRIRVLVLHDALVLVVVVVLVHVLHDVLARVLVLVLVLIPALALVLRAHEAFRVHDLVVEIIVVALSGIIADPITNNIGISQGGFNRTFDSITP